MIKIRNSNDAAEIYITGDIVDDVDGDMIRYWLDDDVDGYQWPADIRRQFDAIDDNQEVRIYINSNGGSVPAGVAIANMIARHKGHTVAVVDGWCCSIATQIFFAADERRISSNAYLMIHKPWVCACGDANDLMKTVNALNTIQEGIETTYRKAALDSVTDEQIHQMVEDETWLTGDQAAEYFDINVEEETKAVACAGRSFNRIGNIPNGIRIEQNKETALKSVRYPAGKPADKENHRKRTALALAILEGETL